jgi:hypothetical protein
MENNCTCENCHGPVHPDMLLCDKCYVDDGARKYHCLTCKDFMFEYDGVSNLPDWCYFYCHNCHTLEELLEDYNEDQRDALRKYANKYDISIARAVEYQSHCHCCGKTVHNGEFHESEHQCCDGCEQFNYSCFRGGDCQVCGSWYEKNRRVELKRSAPVLAAVSAFKEHKVYSQFFECLPDLVEYL